MRLDPMDKMSAEIARLNKALSEGVPILVEAATRIEGLQETIALRDCQITELKQVVAELEAEIGDLKAVCKSNGSGEYHCHVCGALRRECECELCLG